MHLRLKKRFLRSLCDVRWVYRELRETHDRTTARWPAAPWMLPRASAKRVRCQVGYREDAKGSAAKSVQDRFTALLQGACDAWWVLRISGSCARDARF